MPVNIVVIGAGVVGLSTAVNIQRHLPSARVTIVTDAINDGTTSYGPGGLFIPAYSQALARNHTHLLKRWIKSSWRFYFNLARSSTAAESGVMFISGYDLMDQLDSQEGPMYKDDVLNCQKMSQDEMIEMGFHHFKHGYMVTTVALCMEKYLKWLTQRFEENGGSIVKRHINCFNELYGQYDLVVNCSGHGSRLLADDTELVPVTGQLVRVHAPWMKHFILSEKTYIIPGQDIVYLGVMNQAGSTETTVNPKHTQQIVQECERLCPNLKGAKFDKAWVGVRPVRKTIRVELEMFKSGTNNIPVVHNYGHGHHGIGLSWGTAEQAAYIVREFIAKSKSKL